MAQTQTQTPAGSAPASTPPPSTDTSTPTRGGNRGRGRGRGRGGARGGRTPTSAPAQGQTPIPEGSIPVPPPGTEKPKNITKPMSEAIPITGWGDSDISSMIKKKPLTSFTPNASGYFGLVDEVYSQLYAKYTHTVRGLPRSLFRYFCGLAWWHRILYVQRQNGFHLSTQQKEFSTIIEALELVLPDKIAQYLANLGNFHYNSEEFRLKLLDYEFGQTLSDTTPWARGFLTTQNDQFPRETTIYDFWTYADLPVPGILPLMVVNELINNGGVPADRGYDLDSLAPEYNKGYVQTTENIVGFNRVGLQRYHTSWNNKITNLGFGRTAYPRDTQTEYMASPSTLLFVSEALASIPDAKMHNWKQLRLTRMGNAGQIAFLSGDEFLRSSSPPSQREAEHYSAMLLERLFLAARWKIPDALVTPLACMAYQIDRYTLTDNGQSLFAPWLWYKTAEDGSVIPDQLEDPPPFINQGMNDAIGSFDLDLRAIRYLTHSQQRSTVLTLGVASQ
jgi:hypothetical protein